MVFVALIRFAIISQTKFVVVIKVEAIVPEVQLLRRVHGANKQWH